MKCHFTYSVPFQNKTIFQRISRKIRVMLNKLLIPIGLIKNRQPMNKEIGQWPRQSPYANTKNIYIALSKVYPTYLYHLTEKVKIDFAEDDVYLGHPYFPYTTKETGVTEFAVNSRIKPRVIALITPLHCDIKVKTTHINKAFLDHVNSLVPKVDMLFAIMGQYWWDEWNKSPYAHWKSKMVRLDMAIDIKDFPFVKKKFNKTGTRRFLYIGKNDPMKGIDFLSKLAKELKDYEFGWIGSGAEIPGVKKISGTRNLDSEYMTELSETYDFFISPSVADPNPTTILESMAWGFPVVCTPQSGYYETDFRKNIFFTDFKKSIQVLTELQNTDEKKLMLMAAKARRIVEADYNWDKFTSTVISNFDLKKQ